MNLIFVEASAARVGPFDFIEGVATRLLRLRKVKKFFKYICYVSYHIIRDSMIDHMSKM